MQRQAGFIDVFFFSEFVFVFKFLLRYLDKMISVSIDGRIDMVVAQSMYAPTSQESRSAILITCVAPTLTWPIINKLAMAQGRGRALCS